MDEKGKGIAVLKGYMYAKWMLDRHKVQACAKDEYGRDPYWYCEKVEGGMKLYFAEHEPQSRRVKRGYGGRHCVDPDSRHANRVHGGGPLAPAGWFGPFGDTDLFSDVELMCLDLVHKVDSIMAEWDEDEQEAIKRKYLVDGAPIADRIVHKSLRDDEFKMAIQVYKNKLVGCLVSLADHFDHFQGGETVDQSNKAFLV
ncbi:hypothetical protein LLE49_23715 [Alicyclobacillus tolerans]|uniref:hypothetical protein n=1 Tax=Alicyclobacillus tolerans TaxID=90970 RepID=UPI001F31B411|nr:hypothetical protein [Alicyclobacillus tolerans]MCF8567732.1 hypothetical protein [Alicyclobacillus tolerans]